MPYLTTCLHCDTTTSTSRPALYCGDGCRSRARHARNTAQARAVKSAATAHAEAALLQGGLPALEAAARRTVALLST